MECGRRRLGAAPVAGEEVRRADLDLADRVIAHHRAVVTDEARRDAREREPHRAGAPLALVRVAHDHERFAHAVALEDRVAVAGAERLEHVRRQRRRAGDEEPYGARDRRGLLVRHDGRVEQAHVHRRHAEHHRRRERGHRRGRGALVEPLEQAHAAAAEEPAVHAVPKAVHVEQRQHREVAIGVGEAPHRRERDAVRRQIVVREHRPLRDARGSGRVDD